MEVATETSGVAAERTVLFGQENTVDLTHVTKIEVPIAHWHIGI